MWRPSFDRINFKWVWKISLNQNLHCSSGPSPPVSLLCRASTSTNPKYGSVWAPYCSSRPLFSLSRKELIQFQLFPNWNEQCHWPIVVNSSSSVSISSTPRFAEELHRVTDPANPSSSTGHDRSSPAAHHHPPPPPPRWGHLGSGHLCHDSFYIELEEGPAKFIGCTSCNTPCYENPN
jgi:hypothetical protein